MKRLPLFAVLGMVSVLLSCSSVASIEERRLQTDTVPTQWLDHHQIPSYSSTAPVLYNTGVKWNERSLQLIEEAEDYIIISIFLGNLYEQSTEVWHALKAKMEEGVRVYCLIDSSSYFQTVPRSSEIVPAAMDYLRSLGIPVTEYNAFSFNQFAFLPQLFDRDHRKYWIIDGEKIALGGININYPSLAYPAETGNIDTMIEFSSPGAIQEMIHSFVATWNRYTPVPLDTGDFAVPQHEEYEDRVWLIDHHWPGAAKTTTLFDAFTLGSEHQLWMVQGYTYLTKALKSRIVDAVNRGVEVNVLLSENAGKMNYEKAAYYSILDLIDAGANVYLYSDPNDAFLHLKLLVADTRYTAFGSPNYNLRSQTLSRELAAVFEIEEVATEAMQLIDSLLEHARPIYRDEALTHRTPSNYFFHLLMQVYG